jgi:hypothetical protein
MRLTVRRKACRRGHAIAVGAVSQSCPSVGWMGKVSSGCAGRNGERKGGWVVVRDKLRWYVLERGMGAYRGEVLQRAEGGDQPEFCVRSRDEAIWDIAQVFRECCLARTCFPYVRLRCHYNIFTCTFKSSFPQ